MPDDSRNPEMKKNKSVAREQNDPHGSVGETALQLGSDAAPIEDDAMIAEEISEIVDIRDIQLISSDILQKIRAKYSRKRDHPLPIWWQSALSSLRSQAAENLSKILHLLEEEHDGEPTERSEKLAPGAMKQRDQTTPNKEDPPLPGQVPLHFHIYSSALLPEPYVSQGWHYAPVLQHQAPTPAGGNQFVPVQQHGQPTPAAGYQSVPAQQYARPIRYMPMPHIPYPPRPGYLPYNQQTESSQPPHGNDEKQQVSQADNPSQNNFVQVGFLKINLGTHTAEIQEEKSSAD